MLLNNRTKIQLCLITFLRIFSWILTQKSVNKLSTVTNTSFNHIISYQQVLSWLLQLLKSKSVSEAHHPEMLAEAPPRAAVLAVSLPWGELRAGPASSPVGHFFLTQAGGHGCS